LNGVTNIRITERILLAVGLVLLLVWAGEKINGIIGSMVALERFEASNSANPTARTPTWANFGPNMQNETSQWSAQRILAYERSLTSKNEVPIAVLRIPKISLRVPIFDGTDDLTLDRGVGRIVGTAQVGHSGNLGIAGHRDGFFRGLQWVGPGDAIELDRPSHLTDIYTVTEIRVVAPTDTYVLDSTTMQTLTLVTCYPFYFVGSAPKRYIVTASLASASHSVSFVANDINFSGRDGQP
jgi:sortase A